MISCKKFLGFRLPYFMQTPERQERERQIGIRAVRMAAHQADYCVNICSYAHIDLKILSRGGNPRPLIRHLKTQVKNSIRHPEHPYSVFGDAWRIVQERKWAGDPYYLKKEVRKEFIERRLAEIYE